MKILNDFSELTDFVHNEFMKLQESYGFKDIGEKNLNKIAKTVLNCFGVANSTTKKKLKYNAKVDWAIFTAPHCWLWKFFNRKLWLKCKEEMARREEERLTKLSEQSEKCNQEEITPQAVDLSALSLESTVITPEERLLNGVPD